MHTTGRSDALQDSRGLLGDASALRARLAETGYLYVSGLLDPEAVRTAGRVGLGHLQRAGWTAPGADPVTAPAMAPVRAVRMRDAFGLPGYRELFMDPSFHELAFAAPLVGLVRAILGDGAFCYPLRLPRVVYPARMVPRQPGGFVHKDYGLVQDMLTCWVPLGDVERTLGGLAVAPGSQHTARVAPRPLTDLPDGWRTADYRAGDVLVFHCLTTHAALPNTEDRLRFSAEFRWQRADQPAPRRVVVGPYGRELGSAFLRGQPWWHPVPAGLRLVDADPDQPRYPVAPSRLVRVDDRG